MAESKELNYSALGFTAGIIGLAAGAAIGLYYLAPIREKRRQKKLAEARKTQSPKK